MLAYWLLRFAICFLATVGTVFPQSPMAPVSPLARAYLTAALDTLGVVMLRRDRVSWQIVRDSAFLLAAGAQKPSDTYGALDWALHRANKHSFLQATEPGAVSTLIRGRYAYIHVPQRGGTSSSLADSLHFAVASLQDAGACGWIVDLRANGGGNMWPMLAGIGPLLGDSLVGSFGVSEIGDRWFYRHGISGLLHTDGTMDTVSRITVPAVELRDPSAPIAILIDGGTGSSGEAIAVAFRGRHNSRSFGSPTAGFATENRGARLPDGANMVVTAGYYTDRLGNQYGDQIQPDAVVAGPPPGWPFPTDPVGTTAADWLALQPACRGHR